MVGVVNTTSAEATSTELSLDQLSRHDIVEITVLAVFGGGPDSDGDYSFELDKSGNSFYATPADIVRITKSRPQLVVGELLTTEHDQPPMLSVIQLDQSQSVCQRFAEGWVELDHPSDPNPKSFTPWRDFRAAVSAGNVRLISLGK